MQNLRLMVELCVIASITTAIYNILGILCYESQQLELFLSCCVVSSFTLTKKMEFSDELLLMLNMTSAADEYCKIAGSIYLAMILCGLLNIPVIYCHFTRPNSFETTLFILISSCNLVINILGITKAGFLFTLLLQKPNEYGIRPYYSLVGTPEFLNDGLTSPSGNIGLVVVPSAFWLY